MAATKPTAATATKAIEGRGASRIAAQARGTTRPQTTMPTQNSVGFFFAVCIPKCPRYAATVTAEKTAQTASSSFTGNSIAQTPPVATDTTA